MTRKTDFQGQDRECPPSWAISFEYEIELNNGQTLQLNEYTKDVQMVRPDGEQVKVNFDINAVGVYDAATQEVISW